ncbi:MULTISPECIES: glutamate synthase large subunit [unclassified Dehalobacter]|uniref:glutamate synthase large subunit n=1 Tax=unclassified Dehalobacter TaxID=2635733 RepID=UPI000E6B66C3|nr:MULTISPECIES: glutamate synthase large subunit [unclassified Dehalobacter]RJE48868.1 glutamate synthase subunit alpha [Dehalobacter sp. MCB1]TCX52030.1 glutamate synthase large subunit [Dehalobacter sp. 14DCB1]TCX53104.1 glutamate synthase large subunit [Dehalobacter sp. 12DCB1]
MEYNQLPRKQGLYDPAFEHDACGMGFVVNIKGEKSHDIVEEALTVLENLNHRGASGADENTGDGAGILVQIPHDFFKRECDVLGFNLPEKGKYGVGMIFAHKYEDFRVTQMDSFEKIVREEGQKILGWREVPIDKSTVGHSAKAVMPRFIQVFIGRSPDLTDDMDFERKLYVIRKRAEKLIIPMCEDKGGSFYIASLSSKTIVYKGMLTAEQLRNFYLDLSDLDFVSALAMVHSRFSTNTFPSWERAHPNRYIVHNGEINTIRGNVNWMKARQKCIDSPLFDDISKVYPIVDESGSDSAMFDNSLEFIHLTGRSLPHAVMMMIPEPWEKNDLMSKEKKDFYEFNNFIMEPWDGPAAMGFTDGTVIGGVLDRNGLRPSRYYVTKDDKVILASEVGVLDIKPENVKYKGRLEPGKMLLIDTEAQRIISDEEIKKSVSLMHPYEEWNKKHIVYLSDLPADDELEAPMLEDIISQQKAFGYTHEDINKMILPMATDGIDPVGSMGMDSPLAVLSDKPQMLYHYFKQLFAQVTNPPIDGIREEIITSGTMLLGNAGNLLDPDRTHSSAVYLESPILTNTQLDTIMKLNNGKFKTARISILYKATGGLRAMERALDKISREADKAIADGANILVVSDRGVNKEFAAIPALLASSGLHHHLICREIRTSVGIVLETGEAREVHHFCALIGYGVTAINPYIAYETIRDLAAKGMTNGLSYREAKKNYIKASIKGILKVLTKMGISTMRSYHGAQIFEAVGLKRDLIDRYFTQTPSRLEGIGLEEITMENQMRHESAFDENALYTDTLEIGGFYQCKDSGEIHLYNPETIYLLQRACREGNYNLFKDYSRKINDEEIYTLRQLLDFKISAGDTIPIEEVEPVESIVKRFKTGAMSYGSISKEAHECMAIAMNRLGGKSNSGEGGEDPERFKKLPNGDSLISAIKQVASGRFGVTSSFLVNASEIQIKMAQGAKPGEGGQLPGRKVFPAIAKVRHSTPGVELISPPPHHDIYSIEDLAELIHDLKNANRDARINVKLVSEVGVGTIAAGVAKGKADVILISGYDGGTGASPRTSIKNTGLPWELGLAETHQTLVLNRLRDRVVLETDGKLLSGRDVVIAALLGAEEYGFATTPLISMGCVMMRVCNLNTCPVGIATQNEELRKNFAGKPEHVENFMLFVAQEMREIMAKLGFRTINEMVGRTDRLKHKENIKNWKAAQVDLSQVLYQPYAGADVGRFKSQQQNHGLEESLDMRKLLRMCKPALEHKKSIRAKLKINNVDRVVGTIVGSEITKRFGEEGLPEDTIKLTFVGSAGQSFGAFAPKGMSLELEGDANDYIGKGLSGGKIMVYPPKTSDFEPAKNILIGNVAFYGATSGEAYINGIAGERFCVRNSGVNAVVEGVGDHGCEYMTGGKVVILGKTGRNFAAGMSGGVAYILDFEEIYCNKSLILMEKITSEKELKEIREMIRKHVAHTGSPLGRKVLDDWANYTPRFTKIIPRDYKKMMENIDRAHKAGLSGEEALTAAFEGKV